MPIQGAFPNRQDIAVKKPYKLSLLAKLTTLNAIIPDFQVNENAGGALQYHPSISTDGNGNFIITWEDLRDGNYDIYAQRYKSDGTAMGSNFKINDDERDAWQGYPSISTDSSGNFIITWQDERNRNDNIYAQLYASDGTAMGNNFQVDDHDLGGRRYRPSIAVDGSGNFIIAWFYSGGPSIWAKRYASNGTAMGKNFKVADGGGREGYDGPSISTDNSGNFIITWRDDRNNSSNIYAQRLSIDGTTMGSNFQVNDDGITSDPSVASDSSGNFTITFSWRVDWRDADIDIHAQRFLSDGTKIGRNFKVNDDEGSTKQDHPSISMDSNGNFIITWRDSRNEASNIYAQRYTSNGTAIGSNFQVRDDNGSASQQAPTISTGSSGNFMVVWQDALNGDTDIYAQEYTSDGTPMGSNFKANDDKEGSNNQSYPSLSTDASGNFIITWQDFRNANWDIYAQRYSGDGTTIGSNFKVNDDEGSASQLTPSISSDSSGNFIITWEDNRKWYSGYYDRIYSDIYAQRYASDGTAISGNFKVNGDSGGGHKNPSISADSDGNFFITWQDKRDYKIYAQRYASNGTAMGNNFKVNNNSAGQDVPSIATDGSRNFTITWEDGRNGAEDIYAQRFSIDGTIIGTDFKVNDDEGNELYDRQYSPSISSDDSGNFIIAWYDYRNGNWDIYAQQYASDGTAMGSNFKVNDDERNTSQRIPSVSADDSGNFIIEWEDLRNGDLDIYVQRYTSDGTAMGSNFRLTNVGKKEQLHPDVKLRNNRIYSTWADNHVGGTGYDIWANVLDWENPVAGVDDNRPHLNPFTYYLHQNYPNPFNPETTIRYDLSVTGYIELFITNLMGQKVRTLVNTHQNAGSHKIHWDGRDNKGNQVPSGVYLYCLKTTNFFQTKKMVLVK